MGSRGYCRHSAVEGKVAFGGLQRGSADVQAGDLGGAAARGIERKTAIVGKDIQHPFARCQPFHPCAIVPLIEKKTGLLTMKRVSLKTQPIFQKDHRTTQWRAG